MKFTSRQDTDLSVDQLFSMMSDFDRIERILVRRGTEVTRLDGRSETGVGLGWQFGFDWKGKHRLLRLAVQRFERPNLIEMQGESELFEISVIEEFIALTRNKSRLRMIIEIRPRNMRGRLLLQTARLAKGQLDRKFDKRISELIGEARRSHAGG